MANRASGEMVRDQNLRSGSWLAHAPPHHLTWRGVRDASNTVPAEIRIEPTTTKMTSDPPVAGSGPCSATSGTVVCISGSSVLVTAVVVGAAEATDVVVAPLVVGVAEATDVVVAPLVVVVAAADVVVAATVVVVAAAVVVVAATVVVVAATVVVVATPVVVVVGLVV